MSDVTAAFRDGLAEGLKLAVRHLQSRIDENPSEEISQVLRNAISCFNAGIEVNQ